MLDIIIPILNEEEILKQKKNYYGQLGERSHLIFVDGGSSDLSVEVATQYGLVVSTVAGRSLQKNYGVKFSHSNKLLFLHVDSFIDVKSLDLIELAMDFGSRAGCLTMSITDDQKIFRLYERVVNFRAKKQGVIDGDLSMFIQKDLFEELGGFPQLPIMEDILFSKKLDNVTVLPEIIRVSSRRWQTNGFLKTFGLYTLAYIQLWTKLPFFRFKKVSNYEQRGHRTNHICTRT